MVLNTFLKHIQYDVDIISARIDYFISDSHFMESTLYSQNTCKWLWCFKHIVYVIALIIRNTLIEMQLIRRYFVLTCDLLHVYLILFGFNLLQINRSIMLIVLLIVLLILVILLIVILVVLLIAWKVFMAVPGLSTIIVWLHLFLFYSLI